MRYGINKVHSKIIIKSGVKILCMRQFLKYTTYPIHNNDIYIIYEIIDEQNEIIIITIIS